MIMIITFQQALRDSLSAFLVEKGYEVAIPPHRQDVYAWVQEKNPVVVLLDMYLSEPSGLEVLRELRGRGYAGKVVLLAGTSVSTLIAQAWRLGVDHVIGGFECTNGPFHLDQIESVIKRMVAPQG
jgi:phosphoserine phosphatase RsbU/P